MTKKKKHTVDLAMIPVEGDDSFFWRLLSQLVYRQKMVKDAREKENKNPPKGELSETDQESTIDP